LILRSNLLTTLMLATLAACSTQYVDRGKGETAGENALAPQVLFTVHEAYRAQPPECIAILPLQGEKPDMATVRRAVFAHLAPKAYRDVELARVDFVLARDRIDPSQAQRQPALGKSLGCDALLVGEVKEFGKSWYAVYSKVSAHASLKLIRAKDGVVLWEAEHHAKLQDGGTPFSPVALAGALFSATRNVDKEQTLRVVDDLARRLLSTLPDIAPKVAEATVAASFDSPTPGPQWAGDVDAYLKAIAAVDQEAAITQLLAQQALAPTQTEAFYARLIALAPKNRYLRDWGLSRHVRGNYEGGLELFTRATHALETDAEAWFLQGRALTRLNRLIEADSSFVKAIAHNPGNSDYYAALAYVNSRLGRHDRARASYEVTLKNNPNDPFAWYNLAVTDYNAGLLDSAAERFAKAGQLYLDARRYDRVEQVVRDLKDIEQRANIDRARQAGKTLETALKIAQTATN